MTQTDTLTDGRRKPLRKESQARKIFTVRKKERKKGRRERKNKSR